jgi:ATP-binding protein involved in chromosome partitioning
VVLRRQLLGAAGAEDRLVVATVAADITDIYRQLAGRVAAQMYWQGEVIPSEIAFRAV